ncbi:hypothetical protein EDC04DRAFT_2615764 [Pisolithus marmoratus]|nr:hypothetical protein EDC04DRAFT_2615764 [Pisolithus marmoratus]
MDKGRPSVALDSLAFPRGKEDAPLALRSDRKGKASSKKKVYMSPGDDSEASVGPMGMVGGSDSEWETGGVPKRGEVAPGRAEDDTPQETSPAWHASKDRVKFLKSLSIMPRYQELVELVLALPKTAPGMGTKLDMPVWATWAWSAQYLPADIHMDGSSFWKALGKLQSARFGCSLKGLQVVLGFGLLLRECCSKIPARWVNKRGGEGIGGKGGCRVGEEMSGNEGGSEEETPVPRPMKKRKREGSVNLKLKQKVTKGGHHEDEVQGKREQRERKQTKRALGLGL